MNDIKYNTRQRDFILDFIKRNKNEHMTADDIYEHLKSSGKSVGKSTVYRYLDALEKGGEIRKYFTADGKSSCYQYADESCCEHYHLKCSECGRLIHTQCSEISMLIKHFCDEHKFHVDMTRTVIYGKCDQCYTEGEND